MNRFLKQFEFDTVTGFKTSRIIIDPALRDFCEQNACGHYGKNHMCPPAVKSVDLWKKDILCFDKGILLSKIYPLKSSFDMKGMQAGAADFGRKINQARKKRLKEQPGEKILVLGAGPCLFCKTCTYEDGEACRFPDEAVVSMEACGIDVVRLCRDLDQKYHNGQNTVTYFGLFLHSVTGN